MMCAISKSVIIFTYMKGVTESFKMNYDVWNFLLKLFEKEKKKRENNKIVRFKIMIRFDENGLLNMNNPSIVSSKAE